MVQYDADAMVRYGDSFSDGGQLLRHIRIVLARVFAELRWKWQHPGTVALSTRFPDAVPYSTYGHDAAYAGKPKI